MKPEEKILKAVNEIAGVLKKSGIRAEADVSDNETLGFKINKWELKGVPLRVEIGEKEIKNGSATLVRRDTGEKIVVNIDELTAKSGAVLESIQNNLLEEAERFLKANTRSADNYSAFKKIISGDRGFVSAFWCENAECEKKIKEETKATTRCLPLDLSEENGKCVYCEKPAKHRWLFAQAY